MKAKLTLLIFLLSAVTSSIEAQSPIPEHTNPPQNGASGSQAKRNPLQKRDNEELLQQRKFIANCNSVQKTDYHLPDNYVTNIVKIGDGITYTGSASGIRMWDNYSTISITTDNARIPENNITALALDYDGQLWIGTYSSGIVIGNGADVKPFRTQFIQTHNLYVVSIYADAGVVWVAYKNGGLECFINGISCKYFSPYDN